MSNNRSCLALSYPRGVAQEKSFPLKKGNVGETVPSRGVGKMVNTHSIVAIMQGMKTPSTPVSDNE